MMRDMAIQELDPARQHMKSIGLDPRLMTNTVIVAEALARGIGVEKSPKHPRRIVLSSLGSRHTWQAGGTTLNKPSAKRLVSYKEVTSRLLLNRGVNAPENAVFAPEDLDRAWAWGKKLLPLVIKPKDENQGRDVVVGVATYEEFAAGFTHVANGRTSLLVEEFHQGLEHRCLTIDNRLVAVTRRRPASVLGDGESTIEQLVTEKNTQRWGIHKQLKLDGEALQHLAKSGLTTKSVPAEDQRTYLLATSNIHRGGDAIDATDELSPIEIEQVEKAAGQFPGLRLGALDVLLSRGDAEGELSVLEVNANPMITMHHLPWEGQPRDVAGAILTAMFPHT